MSPEVYIGSLVAAITAMAGTITFLFKTIIATKIEQLTDCKGQIAELKAALAAQDAKVDKALDVLGDAVRLIEAGPQPPSRNRGQGGSR